MQVLQVESELEQMLALYEGRKPKRVLEIGVWQGGTLREWLTRGVPEQVVAVDLHHPNAQAYGEWKHLDTKLKSVYGKSQDTDVIEAVRRAGPFDWAFIDGDHGREGVHADIVNYMPMIEPGGVLLLHDIKQPDDMIDFYPPGIEFGALAGLYDTLTFISKEPSDVSHGIGVVYL